MPVAAVLRLQTMLQMDERSTTQHSPHFNARTHAAGRQQAIKRRMEEKRRGVTAHALYTFIKGVFSFFFSFFFIRLLHATAVHTTPQHIRHAR